MTRARRSETWWSALAFLVVVVVAIAMRLASGAGSSGPRFDEQWIVTPIVDLVVDGWSVETAIDFEETKGPGLIWTYAVWGSLLDVGSGVDGDDAAPLGPLRLFTMVWFVLGALPLLMLARWAGVRGAGVVGVAALYVLLPQNAVLGQLLMSESIFIAGSLAMLAVFVWSVDGVSSRRTTTWLDTPDWSDGRSGPRGLVEPDQGPRGLGAHQRLIGPVVVGLLLVWLLHTRIHAVAFAGAICVVATVRDGRRSWPWWLACALAGLSRIPLALRWGGLVSPMYREMHQLGGEDETVVLANVTYLLAALVPLTGVFLIRRWGVAARASDGAVGALADRRWMPIAGAVAGALLGLLASPALAGRLPAPPLWAERAPDGIVRYLGAAATVVRGATGFSEDGGRALAVGLYALGSTIGGASLGALAALAWRRRRADEHGARRTVDDPTVNGVSQVGRTLAQLTVLTLTCGIVLYAATRSFVLDRYLLPWGCLLPILWIQLLDRRLLIVQAGLLVVMFVWGVRAWLV